MPPTLLLIRHAQALHNVSDDWTIHDPPLSELGKEQCAELQQSLKATDVANEVELIVVSAMRRTLETAALGLEWLYKDKKIPVLADAGWQGACHVSITFYSEFLLHTSKAYCYAVSMRLFGLNFRIAFILFSSSICLHNITSVIHLDPTANLC